ncbi:protein CHUP1, chloroplastic-like isoform X1 [Arachis duranensis]|uniref:Protein CHUP1, chloroplastic-like isoform X1 n=2 Tax=Arachis duranensis TaxID=130453 RepID=A0A6P4C9V4_ARADU|nr:protein CHUP1, chloroplastic-like isoform X1 [Arachis duranensis]
MIVRVSFLVVTSSIAVLKILETKTNFPAKRSDTMKSLAPAGCDASPHLELKSEDIENNTANATYSINQNEEKHMKNETPQKLDYATEKELLQNLVENYKQREVSLQKKLLRLNGLKEEQSAIAQLRTQLEEKNAKFDLLKTIIDSMEAENKTMQEKARDDGLSKKHLEIAKKTLNEMERKRSFEGSRVEEQILMLEKQVTKLKKQDSSSRGAKIIKKIKDIEGVGLEALELKRRNKELELEKREIGAKLITINDKVKTEEETVALIKEEITSLRQVHEGLLEQVERLQRNRFEMVEELVYQRWLFTCLRYELNHSLQKRATREEALRRSCIKNSESYEKDQIAVTYEHNDPELESNNSSNTTTLDDDDDDEDDETETTTLDKSSSSSQSSSSKSSSLLSKMKRWRKIKHDCSKENNVISSPKCLTRSGTISSPIRSHGLIRRFSMPMVLPSDLSTMPLLSRKIGSNRSLERSVVQKSLKRVSFGDCSVKPSNNEHVSDDRDFLENKQENSAEHEQELDDEVVSKLHSQKGDRGSGSVAANCWKDLITAKTFGDSGFLETKQEEEIRPDELINSNKSLVGDNEGSKNLLLVRLVQLVAIVFFSLVLLQAYFRVNSKLGLSRSVKR